MFHGEGVSGQFRSIFGRGIAFRGVMVQNLGRRPAGGEREAGCGDRLRGPAAGAGCGGRVPGPGAGCRVRKAVADRRERPVQERAAQEMHGAAQEPAGSGKPPRGTRRHGRLPCNYRAIACFRSPAGAGIVFFPCLLCGLPAGNMRKNMSLFCGFKAPAGGPVAGSTGTAFPTGGTHRFGYWVGRWRVPPAVAGG